MKILHALLAWFRSFFNVKVDYSRLPREEVEVKIGPPPTRSWMVRHIKRRPAIRYGFPNILVKD